MIIGNITEEQSKEVVQSAEQIFDCASLGKDDVTEVRCVKVPKDRRINYNYQLKESGETNSAINLYFQYDQRGLRVDLINCKKAKIY